MHSIPSVMIQVVDRTNTTPIDQVSCPVMAYMIWDYNDLLINYFFANRSFNLINGVLSEPNPINTGVPQGSVLGPLLFLILFSDVHSPLRHCKILPDFIP